MHPFPRLLTVLLTLSYTVGFAQFDERQFVDLSINPIYYSQTADIDGDGVSDLVLGGMRGVAWLRNSGTNAVPTFGSQQLLTPISTPIINRLHLEDINEDGDIDILAWGTGSDVVLYLANAGGGAFAAPQMLSTQRENPRQAAVGDMDGNGTKDIVMLFEDDQSHVTYLSNPLNDQLNGIVSVNNGFNIPPRDLFLIDGDDDGDLDFGHSNTTGLIRYLLNDGSAQTPYPNSQYGVIAQFSNPAFRRTAGADIDGDGDLDLICRFSDSAMPFAYIENLADGTFGTPGIITTTGGTSVNDHLLRDVNGDGHLDIVGTYDAATINYYPGDGNFGFGAPQPIPVNLGSIYETYAWTDFNADGMPDLLDSDGIQVFLRENIGGGNFAAPVLLQQGKNRNLGATLADLDHNGTLDLLLASENSDLLSWYANDGTGQFETRHIIAELPQVRFANAADLDNDGDLDVISSSPAGIIIHERTGPHSYVSSPSLTGNTLLPFARDVVLLDIDEDGDLDILTGNTRLKLLLNNGNLDFSSPVTLADDFKPFMAPVPVDLDQDGDIDFVGGDPNSDKVTWLRNDGNLSFSYQVIDGYLQRAFAYWPTDHDEDGLLDLIVSSDQDDNIYLYRGTGNGNFATRELLLSGFDYPRHLLGKDVDNDGDEDLLVVSYYDQSIFLFPNLGGGTYAAPVTVENAQTIFRIVDGDLDNDGDIDLVSVGLGDDVTWYANQHFSNGRQVVQGKVFWDLNSDGIQDADEVALPNFAVELDQGLRTTYTRQSDAQRNYRLLVDPGSYSLRARTTDGCWEPTSTPAQVVFNTPAGGTPLTYDFGVNTASDQPGLAVAFTTAAPTRCGFTINGYLSVTNTGCLPAEGRYGFLPSPLLPVAATVPPPTATSNDTLFWDFGQLLPGETAYVNVALTVAGVDAIGDTIRVPAVTYRQFGGVEQWQAASVMLSEIRCAYDPNDKQVLPRRSLEGVYTADYTLPSEELQYTIRFQNTGTDTAFTVLITDQLSTDLDWSTFAPRASSHAYTAEISETGLAKFRFDNILLPDSIVNEPASHGFVSFGIRSRANLPDFTTIENTANIFFDFNPAIVTNTTVNVITDPLPPMVSTAFTYTDDPNSLTLNFTDMTSNAPSDWEWDFGDGTMSTAQNPVHTYLDADNYNVCLTSSNAFSRSTVCRSVAVGAVSTDGIPPLTFDVSPNPTSELLTIRFSTPYTGRAIQIYDAAGKPLVLPVEQRGRVLTVDAASLSSGIYTFRLTQHETTYYGKFVRL